MWINNSLHLQYLVVVILWAVVACVQSKTCKKNDVSFKAGESYSNDCDIFTCKKVKKKYKFVKSFNETHCCQHDGKKYKVGEFFNTTELNISCTVSQLNCVNVSDFRQSAKVVEVVHHNHCCAYRHRARGPEEWFDEFFNRTVLDRHKNFTLYLAIDQNVTVPEKCMNITCRQVDGIPVLSSEMVHRSCNCCYHQGSLYPDGARNITLEDGRNASCCGGELVLPASVSYNVTGSSKPGGSSPPSPPSPSPSPASSGLDPSLCWSSCMKADNDYHKSLLEIIEKLREEQAAKQVKGTCFVLDSSLSPTTPVRVYNYQRNLAMLLSLTLPVNSTNPMFMVKYQNYMSCSKYYPELGCKVDKCEAAKAIGVSQNMKMYEQVKVGNPYLGMMWHGMALAHGALTDSDCGVASSKEMVVALTNKVWLNNGGGGGNGYHSNWLGPDALGRTVAAVGVDQAHLQQSQSVSSRPDLAWQLQSEEEQHESLKSLLQCVDTKCCSSHLTSVGGIAKSGQYLSQPGPALSINGTEMSSAELSY